jgi:hypothetical protein
MDIVLYLIGVLSALVGMELVSQLQTRKKYDKVLKDHEYIKSIQSIRYNEIMEEVKAGGRLMADIQTQLEEDDQSIKKGIKTELASLANSHVDKTRALANKFQANSKLIEKLANDLRVLNNRVEEMANDPTLQGRY